MSEADKLRGLISQAKAEKAAQVQATVNVRNEAVAKFQPLWDAASEWTKVLKETDQNAGVFIDASEADADGVVSGKVMIRGKGSFRDAKFKIQGSRLWWQSDKDPHGANDLSQLIEKIRLLVVEVAA